VSSAETAELIDLPFGLLTRVGRRMHRFNCIHEVVPMCPHGRTHCRHWQIRLNHLSTTRRWCALRQITFTTCYLWTRPLTKLHREP